MTNFTPPAVYLFLTIGLLFGSGCFAEDTPESENAVQSLIVEDITFQNGEVALAGSLLFCGDQTGAAKPAVLFVPGSGDGPRTWFIKIAEFYAAQGFIALIYDKRGSGDSGGNWVTSSLDDLAEDVVAGLELLKNNPRTDQNRIGVFGVSQGGWVIPLAAGKTEIPSFGIIITGGGATPRLVETSVYQGGLYHGGASEEEVETAMSLLDEYFEYLSNGQGYEALVERIEKSKAEPWYPNMALGNILPAPANQPNWAWVAHYDPAADIGNLSFPVLVLFGGQDFLAPADLGAKAWRAALENSKAENSKVLVFEDAGHGLVIGGHGQASEGERTYVDGYFETQFEWLRERGILFD